MVLLVLSADPNFGLSVGDSGQPQRPAPPLRPPRPPACAPRAPDRACTTDADCTSIQRTVSCCGTQAVNGLSRADAEAFSAWEAQCGTRRACGCMAGPTRLDDGSSLEWGAAVGVACRAGQCTTFAVPAACTEKECGPAPLYPTRMCPDGVHQSGRGPCAREAGVCRWTRLECP